MIERICKEIVEQIPKKYVARIGDGFPNRISWKIKFYYIRNGLSKNVEESPK